MKTLTLLTLTLLLTAAMALTTTFAEEDSPQWLPEGAIARLGKGTVYDIQFSADGTRLIVAGHPAVWHYDAQTGEEVNMIPWNLNTSPQASALSPDGTIYAIGNFGDNSGLLDAHTGEYVKVLGHTMRVSGDSDGGISSSFAFSADGTTLANGTRQGTIRLWDVATGTLQHTLTGHTKGSFVAFSPDGRTLASGSGDTTVRLWDVATGTVQHILTEEGMGPVFGVAFSPDGRTLASGAWRKIRLWDVATGTVRQTLTGHTGPVESVVFSPDGRTLASGSYDDTVRLWDVATGTVRQTLTGRSGSLYNVAFSPDGRTLASEAWGEIRLWDVATGTVRQTLTGHTGSVYNVVFSPDGRTLASGSYHDTVRLWDVATGTLQQTLTDTSIGFAFSPDGRTLASGSGDTTVRLWDVATGTVRQTLTGHTGPVESVVFSPDGRTLASGSRDKTIRLWDVATGTVRQTLTEEGMGPVFGVVFSPDGATLASGSRDKTIRLWDVQTGHLRATITGAGSTSFSNSLAFNPDGTTLIMTANNIRVWDVRNAKQVKVLGVQCSATSGPAMSPDGRFIAVGEALNDLLLIDIIADKRINYSPRHDDGLSTSAVAMNPDGSILACGRGDGTIILWDLTPFTSTEQSPQEHSDSVRVIYFQPSDRDAQPGINANLRTLVTDVQQFYAEQMEAHGHGEKTLTFATDANGTVSVHHFTGEFTDAYYQAQTYDKVQKELSESFYQSKHVYLVAIDISSEVINDDGTCGVGGGGWSSFEGEKTWHRDLGGLAVIPASGACFNVGVTAHELGHAMGLDHDFRDDTYLMAYGSQQRLSRDAAAWLDASRLFNPSQPDLGQPAAIEGLSNRAGQLLFQLTDGDGLHQAQLLIPTTPEDPAQGTKLHRSQALNGKQSLTIAFSAVPVVSGQEVTLQVIDVHGNIAKQAFSIGTTGGVQIVGDINGDGIVNIQDLVLVANAFGQTGQQTADVNGDGIVNIADLVKVAGAIGGDAAAPAAMPEALEFFSTAEVQQWLVETKRLSLTDAMSQRGVRFLEQLLAILTPKETVLLANYPNPFNPETWLPYRLAEPAEVTVRIYAANGSLIRTLALGHLPAGIYESRSRAAYWDGRNAQGEPVASGVYFYTLSAGDFTATRKMVIRK